MPISQWSCDEELWDQFREGDNDCFELIYNTHIKTLISYGRRINNDHDLVANCVQQLFTNLLDRRKYLGPTNSIKFYLIKSFRSILIKELKKTRIMILEHSGNESQKEHEGSIEDRLIYDEQNKELSNQLSGAIDYLSPREKEILYLKFYSDISNKEISELLSISYQSVKNTATRAIQKLKEKMVNVA